MLAFTNFQPGIFPIDQRMRMQCANVSCEKVFLFCEAVIWNWHDTKANNAGFCGHQCALDAMNYAAMGRA